MPLWSSTWRCLPLLVICAASAAGQQTSQLTSRAIDPTLFRDGAVTRFSGAHEGWRFVCDEVRQLKQRFCSLRTMVRDGGGGEFAELTISTGEDGRPARPPNAELLGTPATGHGSSPCPFSTPVTPSTQANVASTAPRWSRRVRNTRDDDHRETKRQRHVTEQAAFEGSEARQQAAQAALAASTVA